MDNYVIPNLSKAMQMLKLLASSEHGLSTVEIESRLDIPRTTAFRILKTLLYEGLVCKQGPMFTAGAGLFEIGLNALSRSQIRERAVPLLHELTRSTGQTSHLAVPSGWNSLILEVCDSPNPIRAASRPGTLAELNCSATGKIFLSFIYQDRLQEYYSACRPAKRTSNTICELPALQSMTEQIRQMHYAKDEEEYHVGVRCLAAPVFDMKGVVVAAIGVTGPTVNFVDEDLPFVCEQVRLAAERLSSLLGCKTK